MERRHDHRHARDRHATRAQAAAKRVHQPIGRRFLPRPRHEPGGDSLVVAAVAGVATDLFITVIDGADTFRIEGEVAANRCRVGIRLFVGPGHVRRHGAGRVHAPVRRVALERTMRDMRRPLEQCELDILAREVVRRRQAGLVQDQGTPRVGEPSPVQLNPHAPRAGLETDLVVDGHVFNRAGEMSYCRVP